MEKNREFKKGVRFYKTKHGFWSTKINAEDLEVLVDAAEGGKLSLRILDDESRKSDKSPHAYLNILSPGEVADMDAEYQNKGNTPRKRSF